MYYGREGELKRLWQDEHDHAKSKQIRYAAMKTRQTILKQLEDKTLMKMRERLIRASQASDEIEMARIGAQMRDYTGEDKETGLLKDI